MSVVTFAGAGLLQHDPVDLVPVACYHWADRILHDDMSELLRSRIVRLSALAGVIAPAAPQRRRRAPVLMETSPHLACLAAALRLAPSPSVSASHGCCPSQYVRKFNLSMRKVSKEMSGRAGRVGSRRAIAGEMIPDGSSAGA